MNFQRGHQRIASSSAEERIGRPLSLVSINGSPHDPSRTGALVAAIGSAVSAKTGAEHKHIALAEAAPHFLTALRRDRLGKEGEVIVAAVESADILVVGTPVYRASFTGILKHLLDLIDPASLKGRVAVLAATGGSQLHGLVTEHQLRPLLSFFGAHTAPTAIYASEADFTDYRLSNPAVLDRIESAAADVAALLDTRSHTLATHALPA